MVESSIFTVDCVATCRNKMYIYLNVYVMIYVVYCR